jgi:hypothetical protein
VPAIAIGAIQSKSITNPIDEIALFISPSPLNRGRVGGLFIQLTVSSLWLHYYIIFPVLFESSATNKMRKMG